MTSPSTPQGRVLSTLNQDGSRNRIRPRLSRGSFYRKRQVVAYVLIAIFTAIPYIHLHGKPLILLDLPRREFTLFGTTFLPTDSVLLMLLLVGVLLTVFLLTALWGRVWCGWACPQTVYMEWVYRPLERLFEGSPEQQRKRDREGLDARRIAKNAVFVLVSMFLAHTFLAYFVGVETLLHWVQRSPIEHPAAFLVMATVTGLMVADFGWFREQTCLVACPYGRLQSVLIDKQSMIVGYDPGRGEPRGKPKKRAADQHHGDCIDCGACVLTCPTGIDIREGLQMECIGCTQCIDACDAIMLRTGRQPGLIRYTSQDQLAGKVKRLLRPRLVIYPAVLLVVVGLFGLALGERAAADVTILRGIGSPFALLPTGEVSNPLRIKIVNRSRRAHDYRIELLDAPGGQLIAPQNPVPVAAGHAATAFVFATLPRRLFKTGERHVRLRVSDGSDFSVEIAYELLGPESGDAGAPEVQR